jgi:hypothetical protein
MVFTTRRTGLCEAGRARNGCSLVDWLTSIRLSAIRRFAVSELCRVSFEISSKGSFHQMLEDVMWKEVTDKWQSNWNTACCTFADANDREILIVCCRLQEEIETSRTITMPTFQHFGV